jgi:hypothetical protein
VSWVLGVAGGVVLVLAVAGTVLRGFGGAVGRVALGVQRGVASIGVGSCDVRWTRQGWVMLAPGARPRVVAEARSAWRPTTTPVSLGLTVGGVAANYTLWIVHVPLGPPAGLLLVGWALLRWVFPGKDEAGACGACGYDLRGVAGVCPECGAGRGGA